jgi:polar amino acid transport system substrate-binding protein
MTGIVCRLGWAVAIACCVVPVMAQACVKTVRWSESPPYAFKDSEGKLRGLHTELIREALRKMQCEPRFLEMPWARALHELQAGRLDMLPGAADTEQRKEFAWFSKPTNSARNVMLVRVDSRQKYRHARLADLIGTDFRLAVRRGATYGEEYDALLEQPQFASRLTFVASVKSGLQMMAAGRVEGMLVDELTGILAIAEMGLGKVAQRSGLVTSTEADLVAFSKATTDKAFVDQFNAALDTMAADGSYRKLLERYMPCSVSVEKLGCR